MNVGAFNNMGTRCVSLKEGRVFEISANPEQAISQRG
jgi:hypothetical protein